MNINIETKFNVGDTVYTIEHYYDYYPSKPYVIVDIDIINLKNKQPKIIYQLEGEGHNCPASEHICFATYEECTKWCEDNN